MQMDFYGAPQLGGPALGLEEGQVRLTCSPGMSKVYLQEFPWEKCVPDAELETTAPYEVEPPPTELIPVEEPLPPEPAPPAPPGKARFLDVDPTSGALLDPDTGQEIRPTTVLKLSTAEAGITAGVGLLAIGLTLAAFGVFGGK
jgi:hypothetical protein